MLTTSAIGAAHRGHGGNSFDFVRCCPDMKSTVAEGPWFYVPYLAITLERQGGSADPRRYGSAASGCAAGSLSALIEVGSLT
jgi:hypothetical protein